MKTQQVSILLTILLLSSFFSSVGLTNSISTSDEVSTIYVDDDNTIGPWDGSIQHPYNSITDAVNIAVSNQDIFVYSGEYNESIIINKNVKITGENKTETIIKGSIEIKQTSGVIFSQFSITKNDQSPSASSALTLNQSEKTQIFDNILKEHNIGIHIVEESNNNLIKQNLITQNNGGLDICFSSLNLIYGNQIVKNQNANIILYHSKQNVITQNLMQNSENNLQFHTSKDTINQNYWGSSKNIQFILGQQSIQPLNIVVPWIKILFQPLTSPDQIAINPITIMDTSLGSMTLELYKDKMPITTQNFIDLAHLDFFDDLVFHRVIDDFVIQGGGYDINGDNKESPLGSIPLETHPDINHVDGAISMARTNDPNSATSQFFICDGDQHGLDGNYAAFGKILLGFQTLQEISSVETTRKNFMDDWPVEDVVICDVSII
jgi:parallel beta-helix repeat protein